jgi:hypothetical protein
MAKSNTVKKSNTIELATELSEVSRWIKGAVEEVELLDEMIERKCVRVSIVSSNYSNINRLYDITDRLPDPAKQRLLKHYRRVVKEAILDAKIRQEEMVALISKS